MVTWTHINQRPKRHLDRFTCFCTAHPFAQHTDTQTTLHVASIAIDRIYAMYAMRPNKPLRAVGTCTVN